MQNDLKDALWYMREARLAYGWTPELQKAETIVRNAWIESERIRLKGKYPQMQKGKP